MLLLTFCVPVEDSRQQIPRNPELDCDEMEANETDLTAVAAAVTIEENFLLMQDATLAQCV